MRLPNPVFTNPRQDQNDLLAEIADALRSQSALSTVTQTSQSSFAGTPDFYHPEVTDLASLKTILTDGRSIGDRINTLYKGFSVFILREGIANPSDPGQVQPNDYNALTNTVHWEQRL